MNPVHILYPNFFEMHINIIPSSMPKEAGIVQLVQWLWAGTAVESEFKTWYGQDFSPLKVIQTSSEVHPASYPMGSRALSPGVKQPGCEPDHSTSTSAEVKNT
jgi:hypothetical protein